MVEFDRAGTSSRVDEVLGNYPGLHAGLFSNETDALLAALVIEQRAERYGERPQLGGQQPDPSEVHATYAGHAFDVESAEEWAELEPGFVAGEVDIRADAAVQVAFEAPATSESSVLLYRASDLPVTGIPVRTGKVWVRANSSADTPFTAFVDAWGDA